MRYLDNTAVLTYVRNNDTFCGFIVFTDRLSFQPQVKVRGEILKASPVFLSVEWARVCGEGVVSHPAVTLFWLSLDAARFLGSRVFEYLIGMRPGHDASCFFSLSFAFSCGVGSCPLMLLSVSLLMLSCKCIACLCSFVVMVGKKKLRCAINCKIPGIVDLAVVAFTLFGVAHT